MAWGLNVSSVLDRIGCSQPRSVLYPNSWFSLVDAYFGGFFLLFAFSVAGIDCLAILDSGAEKPGRRMLVHCDSYES